MQRAATPTQLGSPMVAGIVVIPVVHRPLTRAVAGDRKPVFAAAANKA